MRKEGGGWRVVFSVLRRLRGVLREVVGGEGRLDESILGSVWGVGVCVCVGWLGCVSGGIYGGEGGGGTWYLTSQWNQLKEKDENHTMIRQQ